MVQVLFQSAGKQFREKWVIRDLRFRFDPGRHYAVLGKNGTGKSTLLRMAAGYLGPTRGKVQWFFNGKEADGDDVFSFLSFAAPYMELPEEVTLPELLRFHFTFKPLPGKLSENDVIALSGLGEHETVLIRDYSSGMKQRARLLLAMVPETPLVLLDEPCTNLDSDARSWYARLLGSFGKGKTVIVASNHDPSEYPGNFIQLNI